MPFPTLCPPGPHLHYHNKYSYCISLESLRQHWVSHNLPAFDDFGFRKQSSGIVENSSLEVRWCQSCDQSRTGGFVKEELNSKRYSHQSCQEHMLSTWLITVAVDLAFMDTLIGSLYSKIPLVFSFSIPCSLEESHCHRHVQRMRVLKTV